MVLVDQGRLPLGEPSSNISINAWIAGVRTHVLRASVRQAGGSARARASKLPAPFFSRLRRDWVRRMLPTRTGSPSSSAFCEFTSALNASLRRATWNSSSYGLAERERLLPTIESQIFFPQSPHVAVWDLVAERVALFAGCIAQVRFSALHGATIPVPRERLRRRRSSAKTCVARWRLYAGVRQYAGSGAYKSRCICATIRCCGNQRRRLRLDTQGIRAAFAEGGRSCQGHAFRKTKCGRHRVSCRPGLSAPIGIWPRNVSGFLPSACTAENQGAQRKMMRGIPALEMAKWPWPIRCGSRAPTMSPNTQTSLDILGEMKHARKTNAPRHLSRKSRLACWQIPRALKKSNPRDREVVHVMSSWTGANEECLVSLFR